MSPELSRQSIRVHQALNSPGGLFHKSANRHGKFSCSHRSWIVSTGTSSIFPMAERRFTDSNGKEWRVHLVVITPKVVALQMPRSTQFRPANMSLAFENYRERRRLAPVPHGWEHASAADLEQMLDRALTITIRIGENR